jgi:hypothetical protein
MGEVNEVPFYCILIPDIGLLKHPVSCKALIMVGVFSALGFEFMALYLLGWCSTYLSHSPQPLGLSHPTVLSG